MAKDVPESKGLYMLYYDNKDHQYPFFIGSTGSGTFRRSLSDQYQKEGGAIRTILEGKFPTKHDNFPIANLKVQMLDIDQETKAKLFERAFLETFYFALNDQETRATRYDLDTRNEVMKPAEAKNHVESY